jgi:Tfp pilus assembly protein PilX
MNNDHYEYCATDQKGFALIATISVMVLLVLVALAMLSLSTLELKTARQDRAIADAQSNARMALMLAIGELQKTAGPDQRITAGAGLMDTDKSGHHTIEGVANPYWTGVWQSDSSLTPGSYTDRKANLFLRWLVSMKNGADATTLGSAQSSSINDPVKMVGLGTSGSIDYVIAEKIISKDNTNAHAWWVGDESLKTRINIPAIRNPGGDRSWQQALNQSAPISGTGMSDELSWLKSTSDENRQSLQKIVSQHSLPLHPESPASTSTAFHDFTLHSLSLPTDVLSGGLKWDMSRLFAHEKLPDDFTDGERILTEKDTGIKFNKDIGTPLYEAPQNNGAIPDWQRLADYHRLYHLVQWDGNKPYIEYNDETWMKLRSLACSPPMPLITRMQIFYSLTVGQYNRLTLVIEPVITYWNPYNVEIRIPSDQAYITMRSFWQSIRIQIMRSGAQINSTSYHRNLFFPTYPNTNMKFNVHGMTLEPGETKVFSDRAGAPFDWNRNRTVWGHSMTAEPGWENKGGFMGDGYGRFGTVSPGQTLSAVIEPWSSFHTEFSHWGQRGTNMWHQMDLIRRSPGLWSNETFKNIQMFLVEDHTRNEMVDLWGFDTFTRNGISTSQLFAGNKIPLCVVDVSVRTERDGPRETLPYLFTSNTHGSTLSNKQHIATDLASSYWTTRVRKISDWEDRTVEIEPNTNRGFFGPGNTADTGLNFVTMREIPTRPPLSLAAYRNFDLLFNPGTFTPWRSDPADFTSPPSTNHVISGGYAHPMLERDKIETAHADPNIARSLYDHSYLSNHALYDKWFHSGIPTGESTNVTEQGTIASVLNGDHHLPNPRLIWRRDIDPTAVTSKISDAQTGHQHVAPYLYIAGGFNVNSTSVEAWRAFLGAMQKRTIPHSGSADETPDSSVFPRQSVVTGTKIEGNNPDENDLWNGYRSLDKTDIDKLAHAIVEQVKVRGPFHSMADFVNRRVSTPSDDNNASNGASKNHNLSLSGTLQSAIDNTDINSRYFNTDLTLNDVQNIGYKNPDAAVGLRAAGAPGYFMQGDLLQALGSSMTVRGDTFLIRAYGESRNSDGDVLAKAWCEAYVQRDHTYLNPIDESVTRENLHITNERFGREFNIISFRWLHEDEI